ncbi:phage tail protein [Pseudomonas alliivorans]|nr:phage tail protein [Pseudomonas alliivorans]
MAKYYCRINAVRGGFFDSGVHGEIGSSGCTIPDGAKEIDDELHAYLVAAQSSGKLILPDADGYPIAIDPPTPDDEELAAIERLWRDAQLSVTDPLVSRHRDEVEEGGLTTLTPEQYAELQSYRRLLRDWPQEDQFPLVKYRPPTPIWLSAQST